MTNLAIAPVPVVEETIAPKNVISFDFIKSIKDQEESKPKRPNNAVVGESSEVYAFRSEDEIAAMIAVLDRHIEEAVSNHQRQIACRNKLLFLIGINVGIRASDLRTLRWSFFFTEQKDGSLKFNDSYKLQPKKQRKQKKFVTLHFNQTVRKAIDNYVSEYPVNDIDDYLFSSRKGDEPITVGALRKIIKNTADEAGIQQNIGSHSLRKTWGFFCWHNAKDKNKALVILQQAFNHSSTQITMKYIGLMDDEISEMYNSIELGFDFI